MRWSSSRVSPPVVAAFAASVIILVGFIAFLIASSRGRNEGSLTVTVGGTPTPGTISVNVTVPGGSPTVPPTVAAPAAPTTAPLATAASTATPPPTPSPPPPPPTAAPAPTREAVAPPPVAAAPPTPEPPPAPAQPAPQKPPIEQPVASQPPPNPPAPAPPVAAVPTPTPQAQASRIQPTPAPPPSGGAGAQAEPAPTQEAPNPSPPGGLGNSRRDIEDAYGAPVGRSPDGFEIYQTDDAEIQVTFRNDRAERLRLKLQRDEVMPLDEARNLARGLIPTDAQPTATRGEETGNPIDQFRSAALAQALSSPQGQLSVRYTPNGAMAYSGFEITLG